MKSWLNVAYVKLIICSQFRHPTCPTCRLPASQDKLLRIFFSTEYDEQEDGITEALATQVRQKDEIIGKANERLKILKKQNLQFRLVVNATCIYTTDVEETTL